MASHLDRNNTTRGLGICLVVRIDKMFGKFYSGFSNFSIRNNEIMSMTNSLNNKNIHFNSTQSRAYSLAGKRSGSEFHI